MWNATFPNLRTGHGLDEVDVGAVQLPSLGITPVTNSWSHFFIRVMVGPFAVRNTHKMFICYVQNDPVDEVQRDRFVGYLFPISLNNSP